MQRLAASLREDMALLEMMGRSWRVESIVGRCGSSHDRWMNG